MWFGIGKFPKNRVAQILVCTTLLLHEFAGSGCSPDRRLLGVTNKTVNQTLAQTKLASEKGTIILLKEIGPDGKPYTLYSQGADYVDLNGNGLMDPGDQGFFNPGSTIKVAIALAALERMAESNLSLNTEYKSVQMKIWHKIAKDIEKMIVVSDNQATNRIILWLGFDDLNTSLKKLGLEGMEINRLMFDEGTLSSSPKYTLRDQSQMVGNGPRHVSKKPRCLEAVTKVGNCSPANSLISSMIIVATSEPKKSQSANPIANIKSHEYLIWLQGILSKRPHELGYHYEANYCRFIDGARPHDRQRRVRRLLSKCGVAPFSITYSDISYLEMNNGRRYVLFIVKKYPKRPADQSVVADFQRAASTILSAVP